MTVPLSPGTEERLARVFAGTALAEARRLLERECAETVPGWHACTPAGLERLRFAVVRLAGGTIPGLEDALTLAKTDWRDALVAAGFGYDPRAHESWWPGPRDAPPEPGPGASAGTPGSPEIRRAVRDKYDRVAHSAEGLFAYPTGAEGARALGYAEEDIGRAPLPALRSFCGVGNPFALGRIGEDDAVLDLGCGAGFDLLAAGRRARRAVGVDLTPAMVRRARECASGRAGVAVVQAASEALPFRDRSFDVVISNGVLNLSPRKDRSFAEAFRVLRPGGRLRFADIVLQETLPPEVAANPDAWAG